ncbi:MAG: OmpP1/FadL family transporter [Thermodesulfobacteriota bacterium]
MKQLVLFLFLLFPVAAHATNGYWAHGYGTKSKAMAGSGMALPLDAMDAAANPATMVYLDNRLDMGVSFFMPDRGFTAGRYTGGNPNALVSGERTSGNDLFVIPHFAANRVLNPQTAIGISIGANGGMNTEYDEAIFSCFNSPGNETSSPTGIDFKQLFVGLSYSRKISARHSFGITPILAAQSLKVTGLEAFRPLSHDPEHVTNQGYDYSWGGGLKIGWLGRLSDRLSVGLSGQTRLWMTPFEDYQGLFAEEGDFDIPPNLTAGLAWSVTPALTLAVDVQHIFFEEIKAVGNSCAIPLQPDSILLGTDDGIGFGWKNLTVVKLGAQWQWQPDITLRAGYSRSNQVIPEDQALFNTLAPAVLREHYTCGLTKKMKNREINLSLMYAPREKINGYNQNTWPQPLSLTMEQLEIEISFSFLF